MNTSKSLRGCSLATGANDAELNKMKDDIRFRIAFYCSTRAYLHVLRLHGLEDLGLKLRPYPAAGHWSEMAALIPDDVLELFAVVGTHDVIADKIVHLWSPSSTRMNPVKSCVCVSLRRFASRGAAMGSGNPRFWASVRNDASFII